LNPAGVGLVEEAAAAGVIDCEPGDDVDFGGEEFHNEFVGCFVEGFGQAFCVFDAEQFDSGKFSAESFDCGGVVGVGHARILPAI